MEEPLAGENGWIQEIFCAAQLLHCSGSGRHSTHHDQGVQSARRG